MSDEKLKMNVGLVNVDIPKSVDETATALIVPTAQSVGSMLQDIVDLVFGPFHQIMEKRRAQWSHDLASFKQQLENETSHIPSEKLVPPDLQVAAQAVQDSVCCIESEELRNMFVNLLASSIDKDKINDVHPYFSSIIKRITPEDAKVLMRFHDDSALPLVEFRLTQNRGYFVLEENVLDPLSTVDERESISRSLIVLQSLGLIRITYSSQILPDTVYSAFEQYSSWINRETLLEQARAVHSDVKEMTYQKGLAEITDFGKQFLKVCL